MKMLMCDLDGTLLVNEKDKLSEAFITKLKKLTDCGVIFAVNSGRHYSSLKGLLRRIENRTVFVCNHGTQIMYKNCLLYKNPVPKASALKLCGMGLSASLYPYVCLREEVLPVALKKDEMPAFINQDIFKIIFVKEKADISSVQKLKSLGEALNLRVCFEDDVYLEFCNKEANKGTATNYLKNKFGIKNGVCAFGNDENDIPMFLNADKAYIVGPFGKVSFKGATYIESAQEFIIKM